MGTIMLWERYLGTREIIAARDSDGRFLALHTKLISSIDHVSHINIPLHRFDIKHGNLICLDNLKRWSL